MYSSIQYFFTILFLINLYTAFDLFILFNKIYRTYMLLGHQELQNNKSKELFQTNIKINYENNNAIVNSFSEKFQDHLISNQNIIFDLVKYYFSQLEIFSMAIQQMDIDFIMNEKVEKARKKLQQLIELLNDLIENLEEFYRSTIELQSQKPQLIRDLEYYCSLIEQFQIKSVEYVGNQHTYQKIKKLFQIYNDLTQKIFSQIKSKELKKQADFPKYCDILTCLNRELNTLIHQKNFTKKFLEYDPYKIGHPKGTTEYKTLTAVNTGKQSLNNNRRHYYEAEKIIFNKPLQQQNCQYVQPELHRDYIEKAANSFSEIVPIKISKVVLEQILQDLPEINTVNYFAQECEDKLLHYFLPRTKKLISYNIQTIYDALNIIKELQDQIQLKINFLFSEETRSIITPQGSIYITCARSTFGLYDDSFFQYTRFNNAIRSRPNLPVAKKQHSMIYLKDYIYVIGGSTQVNKCSSSCHKYSIKRKQWIQLPNTNFAIRATTLSTSSNRYIFRFGGLNQFNYIDKNIQAYDSNNNAWAVVRTHSKYVNEEIQFLSHSFAVTLNSTSFYVFGGTNLNNFQRDTGYTVQIVQIEQKKKNGPRVQVVLRSLKDTRRTIFSYSGQFVQGSQLIHNNSIYFLRKKYF